MAVCSDMLELILGPINIINNESKNLPAMAIADEITDTKEFDPNQSEIAIACKALSCSIEDNKNTEVSASTNANTTIVKITDKGIIIIYFKTYLIYVIIDINYCTMLLSTK